MQQEGTDKVLEVHIAEVEDGRHDKLEVEGMDSHTEDTAAIYRTKIKSIRCR